MSMKQLREWWHLFWNQPPFGHIPSSLDIVYPTIGSKWKMEPTNPFRTDIATVINVKAGWVEYVVLTNFGAATLSSTVKEFRSLYTEVK